MAFADKKGIVVASPFKLQAESMLDVRQQVNTIAERDELVTIKAATAGLRVYVRETKKSYVYNGTGWDTLSIGGNASLTVTLNGGTTEGTNKFTYNGTANKTINITPSLVGAAPASHTHTKSQITDFPASLKNPYAITFAGATTGTYDGSRAVTITIPTKYSTTNSLIVTLNGGTQEGTNKFTFDGSTEKTINISPNTIGAAASSHTHNVSNITGLTAGRAVISDANGHPSVSAVTATELSYLDGVTSSVQTQLNNKAAVGHTHNYAGSSSAGGAANSVKTSLIIKLNSGTTEGTNMFTFNGATAKSINITPSAIGAAASSHTHAGTAITGLTANRALISNSSGQVAVSTVTSTELGYLDGVTSNVQTQLNNKAASNHTHNYAGSTSAGGAANSAVKLSTARTISLTGDASGSASFDGSTNISIASTVYHHGSTTIGQDADLNDYTDPGWYHCASNTTAATLDNCPTTNAFTLVVSQHAGCNQMVIEYVTATPRIFVRNYYNNAWGSWYRIYHTGQKPTASEIGAASSSHTHTKSQITDFPSSLKNPSAITFTGASTGTYDGSKAITINIPTSASTSSSLVIKLNGGTTEGTNMFTFNGSTAKSVNITPSSIGAAAASHGTHVSYSTTAPKANGTAAAGSASTVARSDHVHPLQTTVSGNAGSATKLATSRTIDGVSFNGTANITHFGTCSTAAATAAKVVSCSGFTLVTGAIITVKFTVTNTAASPTLNVNSTGAKAIRYRGSTISAGYLATNRIYTFVYDGTDYELIGDIDTNTTYGTGNATTAGLTKLYTTTGTATTGTMTQKAITDALSGKASSSHTHNYAGSSSAGGAANSVKTSLVIKLNGGSTEGTNMFTFNGATAKSVNITASSIGAAASSHTHTGTSITGLTANRALVSNSSGQIAVSAVTSTELGYLDGVTSSIQTQLNGKAASNHTHSYAGSSSAGGAATSANKVNSIALTNQDLNDYTSGVNFYYGAGSNTVTNKPSGIDNFGMFTFQTAGGWFTQILYGSDDKIYTRRYSGSTWSSWSAIYSTVNKPTPSAIGAAASSHTHNYAGSSSAGGAANSVKTSLVIKLNGGSTEGTNMFTFNGATAKSINITPSAIGAAASSHGTHVSYSTTAPKANGTAAAGSASTVARSDHVHPLQTTVSGNAGSATKLATARTIDGVSFNGTANITHFGTCSTAAATAAKTVSCTGFTLATGAVITVKFSATNTAANPTLNVNSTGAKAIMYRGSAISAGYLAANRVYTFVYDGTDYELVGDINTDTNTTYGTGTATTAGLTRLYTGTGQNTNGTMTQKAITDAINSASSTAKVNVPVGTVLFATSTSTSFFSSCFGGTWVIDGNVEAIAGSSTITLYMFRKTAA